MIRLVVVCGCCVALAESTLRILFSHNCWHLTDLYKFLINDWYTSLYSELLEGRDCV